MENNISQKIKEFFAKNVKASDNPSSNLILFRNDGVVLYCSAGLKQGNLLNIGALLGGLWQSAEHLSSISSLSRKDRKIFRLSFDNSSSGIYVLPVDKYLIASMYSDVLNPAKLKQQVQQIGNKLAAFLAENINQDVTKKNNIENYLFNNISDAEMDNLFSLIGK